MYFNSVVGASGVKNLSQIELSKMLAGKTASASIGVDELSESVRGNSTRKDFETMLQLAYLKFTAQRFDKSIFDSVIGKQRIALANFTADPKYYFREQLLKILTQNHPRAFDPLDITNLDKAKFEDLQTIYKDRFSDASDFTFVFVGNLEPETIKPLILKYLGNLPSQNRSETFKDWGIKPPAGPLVKVFNKGADDRSTVQILYTGDAEYSRDENRKLTYLGDLLTIKLIETLREEKSGVYGVSAKGVVQKMPHGNFQFGISFACAPQNVEPLVAATMAEIARIQNGDIDPNEVSKVKENRLIRLEEDFKTNSYWMQAINNYLTQGDAILTLGEARVKTNAITKEDLQRTTQKYLKPESKLQFVLMPETAAKTSSKTTK